jgi:SAM-dependent methyltransferase
LNRRDIILHGVRADGLGLEVGGSYMPLAGGWPGLNVRTLDHLDTGALVAKYRDMGVDTGKVVPVDYVWRGERYCDLVGEARFDWIVASHVIEHVPDLVAFVNQCAEILADDGVLTLAIPDRRYTFDYYRPETSLSELIDAHLQHRTASSPGAVAAHFLYYAELSGQGTWNRHAYGEPALTIPVKLAAKEFRRAQAGDYIDAHAWAFTPSSFRLALRDLHELGLVSLREARFHDTEDCEFFVQLSRTGGGPMPTRQELAQRAQLERAMILSSEPPPPAPEPPPAPPPDEVAALRAELAEIRSSTAWRITAPLRRLVSSARSLRR